MRHVISAVCVRCGAEHEAVPNVTTCHKCGGILDIKYDYNHIKEHLTKEQLTERKDYSMWRYRESVSYTHLDVYKRQLLR